MCQLSHGAVKSTQQANSCAQLAPTLLEAPAQSASQHGSHPMCSLSMQNVVEACATASSPPKQHHVQRSHSLTRPSTSPHRRPRQRRHRPCCSWCCCCSTPGSRRRPPRSCRTPPGPGHTCSPCPEGGGRWEHEQQALVGQVVCRRSCQQLALPSCAQHCSPCN